MKKHEIETIIIEATVNAYIDMYRAGHCNALDSVEYNYWANKWLGLFEVMAKLGLDEQYMDSLRLAMIGYWEENMIKKG